MSPAPVKIPWSFLQLICYLFIDFTFFSREVPSALCRNMALIAVLLLTVDKQWLDMLCWFAKSCFVNLFISVMVIHTELELQHLAITSLNTAVPEYYCLGDFHSLELQIQVLWTMPEERQAA